MAADDFETKVLVELAEIKGTLKEYCTATEQVKVTMFGADGRNGVVGDLSQNKADIKALAAQRNSDMQEVARQNTWWYRLLGVLAALSGGLGGYFGMTK